MNEEAEVLKAVCRTLESGRIPYMITGSIAANFYAAPRMTRDIDIVLEIEKEDADKVVKLFENDFCVDRERVSEAVERQGIFNTLHNEYVIKIDWIVKKESSYRKLEFQRRRSVEFEGQRVSIVAPEGFILSKLSWAKESFSEMQRSDVKNLLRMAKNLDTSCIEKRAAPLGGF